MIEDVKKISVIGAGDMGHGIATCCLLAGYTVALCDIEQRFVDRGVAGIKRSLDKFRDKGKLLPQEYDMVLARLIPLVNLREAVKDADFIIEAVPEKQELKRSVFAELDKYSPQHAILASNTSNIKITDIAFATSRPDKVIGCHFFNPAILMKLVEVIKGAKSSDASIKVGYDLAKKIDKVPVIVKKDSPGFIYNRISEPGAVFLSKILEAGDPSPAEFDGAMKAYVPMAPFELTDYVGIDIMYHGLEYFAQALSPDYKPSEALAKYIKEGNLGKKTGKGFYDWSEGRPKIVPIPKPKKWDIIHIASLQVNEATRVLEEGIASSAEEIDLAVMHGGNAPRGPFAAAKQVGYDVVVSKLNEIHEVFKLDLFKPSETVRAMAAKAKR